MNSVAIEEQRVLAIDPRSKGFGFAVFEGPTRLIDWGTKQTNGDRSRNCVKHVGALIARHQPDVLVVEDTEARGSRRWKRVRQLIPKFRTLAVRRRIRFRRISRRKVQKRFAATGASTKHQIAVAIAKQFPELDLRRPPLRRPWMSEAASMAIFDAASLALTFFESAPTLQTD